MNKMVTATNNRTQATSPTSRNACTQAHKAADYGSKPRGRFEFMSWASISAHSPTIVVPTIGSNHYQNGTGKRNSSHGPTSASSAQHSDIHAGGTPSLGHASMQPNSPRKAAQLRNGRRSLSRMSLSSIVGYQRGQASNLQPSHDASTAVRASSISMDAGGSAGRDVWEATSVKNSMSSKGASHPMCNGGTQAVKTSTALRGYARGRKREATSSGTRRRGAEGSRRLSLDAIFNLNQLQVPMESPMCKGRNDGAKGEHMTGNDYGSTLAAPHGNVNFLAGGQPRRSEPATVRVATRPTAMRSEPDATRTRRRHHSLSGSRWATIRSTLVASPRGITVRGISSAESASAWKGKGDGEDASGATKLQLVGSTAGRPEGSQDGSTGQAGAGAGAGAGWARSRRSSISSLVFRLPHKGSGRRSSVTLLDMHGDRSGMRERGSTPGIGLELAAEHGREDDDDDADASCSSQGSHIPAARPLEDKSTTSAAHICSPLLSVHISGSGSGSGRFSGRFSSSCVDQPSQPLPLPSSDSQWSLTQSSSPFSDTCESNGSAPPIPRSSTLPLHSLSTRSPSSSLLPPHPSHGAMLQSPHERCSSVSSSPNIPHTMRTEDLFRYCPLAATSLSRRSPSSRFSPSRISHASPVISQADSCTSLAHSFSSGDVLWQVQSPSTHLRRPSPSSRLRTSSGSSGSSSSSMSRSRSPPLLASLEPLLAALKSKDADKVEEEVRKVRAALKGSQQNKGRLVTLGGVTVLVDMLSEWSHSPSILEHTVTALYNICQQSSGAEAIRKLPSGVASLMKAMEGGKGRSITARENAAAALYLIVSSGRITSCPGHVRTSGGYGKASHVERWTPGSASEEREVAEEGLLSKEQTEESERGGGEMSLPQCGEEENRAVVVDAAGAITLLLGLMREETCSSRGKRDAMLAMRAVLLSAGRETSSTVDACDEPSSPLHRNMRSADRDDGFVEQLVRAGGVDTVLDMLSDLSGDAGIEEAGTGLLRVVMECQAGQEAVRKHPHGLQTLCDLLDGSSLRAAEHVVSLLLCLVAGNERERERVLAEGVQSSLRRISQAALRERAPWARTIQQLMDILAGLK